MPIAGQPVVRLIFLSRPSDPRAFYMQNVALRSRAKEVEARARATYAAALRAIAAAEEARTEAARHHAVGDLRGNVRAVRHTARRALLLRDAVESLEASCTADPSSASYPLTMGECLVDLGVSDSTSADAVRARDAFTRALALAPDDLRPDAVDLRVRALVGRSHAHRALGDPTAALEDLAEAARADPASSLVRLLTARALVSTGRLEAAAAAFAEGVALVEEERGQGCDAAFQPLLELAACERKLHEAREEEEEESESESESSRGVHTRGGDEGDGRTDEEAAGTKEEDEASASGIGWLARAIEHLRWAAQVRPDSVPAAVELGMALLAAGRFEESVDALRRLAGVERPAREAVHALGEAELGVLDVMRRNAWLDGGEPLRDGDGSYLPLTDPAPVSLPPRPPAGLSETTPEEAALLAAVKEEAAMDGHLRGALAAFTRALTIAPGSAPTLAARATACEAAGDLASAEAHYRAAAASTPWSAHGPASTSLAAAAAAAAAAGTIRAVGIVRERCGDVTGALTWYGRALLEDAAHVPSLLSLGDALCRAGEGPEGALEGDAADVARLRAAVNSFRAAGDAMAAEERWRAAGGRARALLALARAGADGAEERVETVFAALDAADEAVRGFTREADASTMKREDDGGVNDGDSSEDDGGVYDDDSSEDDASVARRRREATVRRAPLAAAHFLRGVVLGVVAQTVEKGAQTTPPSPENTGVARGGRRWDISKSPSKWREDALADLRAAARLGHDPVAVWRQRARTLRAAQNASRPAASLSRGAAMRGGDSSSNPGSVEPEPGVIASCRRALRVAERGWESRGNVAVASREPASYASSASPALPFIAPLGSPWAAEVEYPPVPPAPSITSSELTAPRARRGYRRGQAPSASALLAERAELHAMIAREHARAGAWVLEGDVLGSALMLCEEAAEALLRECEAAGAEELAADVWDDVAAAARRRGEPPPPSRVVAAAAATDDDRRPGGGETGGDAFWERSNAGAPEAKGAPTSTSTSRVGGKKGFGGVIFAATEATIPAPAGRGGDSHRAPPRPELGEGVTTVLCGKARARLLARLSASATLLRAQTVAYARRRGVARWRHGRPEECVDDMRAAAAGMIALGLAAPLEGEGGCAGCTTPGEGGCALLPTGWIPGAAPGAAARNMVGGPESVASVNAYLGVSLAACGDVEGGVRALEAAAAAAGSHPSIRRATPGTGADAGLDDSATSDGCSFGGVPPAIATELAKLRMRTGDAVGAERAAAAAGEAARADHECLPAAVLCRAHALHALKRYEEAADELMRGCALKQRRRRSRPGDGSNLGRETARPRPLSARALWSDVVDVELSTLVWTPSSSAGPPPPYLLPVDPASAPLGLGDVHVAFCDGPSDLPPWTWRGGDLPDLAAGPAEAHDRRARVTWKDDDVDEGFGRTSTGAPPWTVDALEDEASEELVPAGRALGTASMEVLAAEWVAAKTTAAEAARRRNAPRSQTLVNALSSRRLLSAGGRATPEARRAGQSVRSDSTSPSA